LMMARVVVTLATALAVELADATSPAATSWEASLALLGWWFPPPSLVVGM
jgi:hypothetical protein